MFKRFPFGYPEMGMGREVGKPFGRRGGMGVHKFLMGQDEIREWVENRSGHRSGTFAGNRSGVVSGTRSGT